MSESKVIFITGGTSGIGKATVRAALATGHRVAASGRDLGKLGGLRQELGASPDQLLTLPMDPTAFAAVQNGVDVAISAFGGIDVAIPNAGYDSEGTFVSGDPEDQRQMVTVNILGPSYLMKAAMPALVKSSGRLIFIGSVVGFKNVPGSLYSVTKFAITAMAENARMLAGEQGVGVTLVAPGAVDTAFWGGSAPSGALDPEVIASSILWAATAPAGVDVNTLLVRPVGQKI